MFHKFIIPSTNRNVGEGEIDLTQVADFISKNNSNEKVVQFLNTVRPVNDDVVKSYLETEPGKKLATSIADARVNQAIKTHDEKFTKEKLPILEAEIREKVSKELNVKETPEQKTNRELKERVDNLDLSLKQEKIRNKALELINENKLPFTKLVDKFLGKDLEETALNIQAFKDVWDSAISEAIKVKMAEDNGRDPNARDDKKPEPLKTQLENAKKKGDLLEQIRIKDLILEEAQKKK